MNALGGNKIKICHIKSYILTLPHPQKHVKLMKCERTDKRTQIHMNLHSKFYDCITTQTLNFSLYIELRRDPCTNRRTIQLRDAPGRPFSPGNKIIRIIHISINLFVEPQLNEITSLKARLLFNSFSFPLSDNFFVRFKICGLKIISLKY